MKYLTNRKNNHLWYFFALKSTFLKKNKYKKFKICDIKITYLR